MRLSRGLARQQVETGVGRCNALDGCQFRQNKRKLGFQAEKGKGSRRGTFRLGKLKVGIPFVEKGQILSQPVRCLFLEKFVPMCTKFKYNGQNGQNNAACKWWRQASLVRHISPAPKRQAASIVVVDIDQLVESEPRTTNHNLVHPLPLWPHLKLFVIRASLLCGTTQDLRVFCVRVARFHAKDCTDSQSLTLPLKPKSATKKNGTRSVSANVA